MGSKAPPNKLIRDEQTEDETCARLPAPSEHASNRLLGRIADALQVPQAALYDPLTSVASVGKVDGDGATDADLDRDCAALLDAFRRITDPRERRRILDIVHESADRV